jgi:large subunit ribosomal protein L18
MRKTNPSIPYRRKRQGKTNYNKRIDMLKSATLRLVIRPSLKNVSVQIIQYSPDGDRVLASANSMQLRKYGWKASTSNISASYLTGLLAGKKSKDVKEAKLDAGYSSLTKACRIYSAVKGIIDSGIRVNVPEEILPDENRIKGRHVEAYAKSLAGSDKYNAEFSLYIKQGIKPEELSQHFEDVRKKIMG